MTPQREAAYLAYVREIEPKLKPILNAIREPVSRCARRAPSCPANGLRFSIVPSKTAAPCFAKRISPARPSWPSSSSSTRRSWAR